MAILQLNACIKKDLSVDYYTMVKFCEKNCKKMDMILDHLEINYGYSIYNLYSLYSVTPCVSYINTSNEDLITSDYVYTSTLLILVDSKARKILHCIESPNSVIDVDKYFEIILKNHLKINYDSDSYFNYFIKENIKEKEKNVQKHQLLFKSKDISPSDNDTPCYPEINFNTPELTTNTFSYNINENTSHSDCICNRYSENKENTVFNYYNPNMGNFEIQNLPTESGKEESVKEENVTN